MVAILHDEVAVGLHLDPLDVLALLARVLELAFAAPVDGDFAVALHLEFDRAVLAPEGFAGLEPFAVAEGVFVAHGEVGGNGWVFDVRGV